MTPIVGNAKYFSSNDGSFSNISNIDALISSKNEKLHRLMAMIPSQASKHLAKRPAEKPRAVADGRQSPARKMNQLRQQLNQKGF